MRRSLPLALAAGALATSTVITGQALYAKRRRDLPTGDCIDPSGRCGDPKLPVVSLVCLGDSTLTGPGLASCDESWIRLAIRDIERERHIVVHSLAVSGACVDHVNMRQLPELLVIAPDVAVVAVGSNDVLKWTSRRRFEAKMDRLVSELSGNVAQVVVGGVGDLGAIARVPSPLSAVIRWRARQVDRVIRKVTAGYANVAYLDVSSTDGAFRSGGQHVFTSDLFHPNSYGHEMWAAIAAPVVAGAIRRIPAR